eukprot:COSAG06_NODE_215_length_20124_cov_3.931735_12_plen_73_part_00
MTGEGALEMNGMRIGKVRNKSEFLSLIVFSLCLSRACLGKMMMHFIYKWHRKKWRFPYVCPELVMVKKITFI